MVARHTIAGIYSPFWVRGLIKVSRLARAVREMKPGAVGAIFALGWIAGFVGSSAALLVAVALLAGLYLARVGTVDASPAAEIVPPPFAPAPSAAIPGLAEALAGGLTIKSVQFAQLPATKVKGQSHA